MQATICHVDSLTQGTSQKHVYLKNVRLQQSQAVTMNSAAASLCSCWYDTSAVLWLWLGPCQAPGQLVGVPLHLGDCRCMRSSKTHGMPWRPLEVLLDFSWYKHSSTRGCTLSISVLL